MRPTHSMVNLKNIIHNLSEIRSITTKQIIAVVKADAYGHGVYSVAKALVDNGIEFLAVATAEEALELREMFAQNIKIMILGPTPLSQIPVCIDNDITLTISNIDELDIINAHCSLRSVKSKVHLALDTGMGRVGVPCVNSNHDGLVTKILPLLETNNMHVSIEGIFTHFASADEEDLEFALSQHSLFCNIVKDLQVRGFSFKYIHCENSAGLLSIDDTICNAVRPGILLYGYYPSEYVPKRINLKPALSLYSKVSFVKDVQKGTVVGYGARYRTPTEGKVLTIPIGYADGLSRSCCGSIDVLINDAKFKLVGSVCMDQSMIFAPKNFTCNVGDNVTIIGDNNWADSISEKIGTIPYEIVCSISKRVPRIYIV